MSEQPEASAARPKGPPGKKYAGLSRNQWLIVGGVFVGVVGYLLWKRRQAAAASNTAAANQGSNECTDSQGNPVDCNQAFAQELADMANALDQLGAQQGGGGSGVTGTVGTTGDGSSSDGTGTAVTQPPGTPTSSTGATATKTAPKTAGAVSGLRASNVTKTSFTASWKAAANATGYAYIVRDLASHTQVTSAKTNSTTVTVSGLRSGTDYNFGVQALPGGAGTNIHVRTK